MNQTQSALSTILQDQKKQSDPLYVPKEAAEYIGITVRSMAVWRCTGRYNIEFIKVGRLVKYRKSALDAFLERRTVGGVEV